MLYLSRLFPNVRTTAARRDLANPYDMHRTLMRAFPDRNEGGPGRVLWRADSNSLVGGLHLLVQSTLPPDWSQLDPGWLATSPKHRKFEPAFRPGQQLRFRLRANPTRRAGKYHSNTVLLGKRIPIVEPAEQIAWLARKAKPCGYRLIGHLGDGETPNYRVAVSNAGIARSRKPKSTKAAAIDHFAAVFDGQLQVTDPDLFARALIQGIGPAKAFGFGLLSIAPVR